MKRMPKSLRQALTRSMCDSARKADVFGRRQQSAEQDSGEEEKKMNQVKRIRREDVEQAYIKRINYELTPQEEADYLDDSLLLLAQERAARMS